MSIFPVQDAFVRGEISPRLHARASLDLYRAGLSLCENFITLPHGGIRKRGATYFVNEVKDSSKTVRLVPFAFSSEQAYCLEFGNLYIRVYAYGARVGTVEVVTPYVEADLPKIQIYQSADQMWIVHPLYPPHMLTREGHTTWTLSEFVLDDGPYEEVDNEGTKLTPAQTGAVHPRMTSNTAPSGTASSSDSVGSAFQAFDGLPTTHSYGSTVGWLSYDFPGTTTKVADAYWIKGRPSGDLILSPTTWTFDGFDGTNWIVLDSRRGQTGWTRAEVRFFEFDNKTAYQSYRLSFEGSEGNDSLALAETGWHESGDTMTPFNLTASSTAGINNGAGFQASDVGRTIRLLGGDGEWRWARITAQSSSTVVSIRLYGHALPDLSPISQWKLGAFKPGIYAETVQVFEERLAMSRRFSVFMSSSFKFENFGLGEEDDDGMEFRNAGGGQANDIVWLRDADGFLLVATTGGIRALSGSGIDEALTPSSFKNRRSRTAGCARIDPVESGASFLYVSASRKALMQLDTNQTGRFVSSDVGQISEHIPKRGIVELAVQNDPDPLIWFPVQTGELACLTLQPEQEVRGMHRHIIGGAFSGGMAIVEHVVVTPGDDGIDDVWLVVKRTINGVTRRYIEIMTAAFEYWPLEDAFQVDCGLTYTGAATGTFSGLGHLEGQTVDALVNGKVFKGLVVSSGSVTLPGGATGTKAHVGLPSVSSAATLELDVGARDGSLIGRRKKIGKVILSLFETDTTGLEISSLQRGRWEKVKIPTIVPPDGKANLFTGNVEVPIDDSWEGQGRIRLRHSNPTPCTIRAITPAFDNEP